MSAETLQLDGATLNQLLASAELEPLSLDVEARFEIYLSLLMRWNARMNLTAVRNPQEIRTRHFVESIACARNLPQGIESLLDFGSGAGFPGIPIALCRPEIKVTLAESQNKKASFLREAVRTLELNSIVFGERAETLAQEFDCVTLRAVDQMIQAAALAASLVRISGWLVIMTTQSDLPAIEAELLNHHFRFEKLTHPLPNSNQRLLVQYHRQ